MYFCSVRRKGPRDNVPVTGPKQAGQARPEDARKDGQIRGRSRWLVHNAGWRLVFP